MSKVTVLWVSKGESSFRTLAIPKPLIFILASGFVLAFVTFVCGLLWARAVHRHAAAENTRNERLEAALAEKEELLRVEEVRSQELWEENQKIFNEFREVQATEAKIRRFLGLNEQSYDVERSHQGGMGPGQEVDGAVTDVLIVGSRREPSTGEFLALSQTLKGSLHEVLAHLEDRREESQKIPSILPATSDKVWLSCNFGWRKDPFTGSRREFHNGVDVAGPWRSPIVAPADGTVVKVGKDRLFGVYVKLKHSDTIKTMYGHLESAAVKAGNQVKRGDVVGYMGNTGRSTGTHLHYSVSVRGKYVDPLDFVWDRPFHTLKL